MANQLISELPSKTTDAATNLLPLWQVSSSDTRKIQWSDFAAWQAAYMIANALISPGGGDFYKDGSVAATAGFTFTYASEDAGSQITNNASPTSSRLRLKGWDNLIGYTTNVSADIQGVYATTDASYIVYKKVAGVVFKMARYTDKNWFMPTADATAEVRVPRTFIQATEPAAALCADGDIWIWG
jgi:hypothetical protein